MKAYQVIAELENTSGSLAKSAIIKKAWDAGCVEFFKGAAITYNKLISFGVKKIIEADTDGQYDDVHPDFYTMLTALQNRVVTGSAATDAINRVASECTQQLWNGWYRRILMRSLRVGCNESTINKVLVKIGTPESILAKVPVFSAQLAQPGKHNLKKLVGKKFLDMKLDGVRLLAFLDVENHTVTFRSRNGIINDNFDHLASMLKPLTELFPENVVLDGEIMSRNFQELMSQWQRKENVDTSDAHYATFDILPEKDFYEGICHAPQHERHDVLLSLESTLKEITNSTVYVVPKILVDLDTPEGQKVFKKFNRDTVEAGYEGIMVKDPDAPYITKRSYAWLKLKPVIDVDLKIIKVNLGEEGKEFENTMGSLTCEGVDDESGKFIRVNVSGGFSNKLRDEIWEDQNNVIGKMVTLVADAITKNQKSNSVHSLRFPQFKCFRPDKD